jgi:hypothetical protein
MHLPPRKGQFITSPWQRHGTATPKKTPCKGISTCPLRTKDRVSWDAQGLLFYLGSNPRRCHGLQKSCPFGAKMPRAENARVILDEGGYSTIGYDLSRRVGQFRSVMDAASRCEEDL